MSIFFDKNIFIYCRFYQYAMVDLGWRTDVIPSDPSVNFVDEQKASLPRVISA